MNSNVKKLSTGAMLSYLSIALNVLTGIVYTPWMIQQIGQSQYGIYTLATSLTSLLMFDFGLSTAVGKYVAEYHAVGDQNAVNRVVGMFYKLYMILDATILAVLVVVFFLIGDIYKSLTSQELETFKIAYVLVSVSSLISFPFVPQSGILMAYEKFNQLKITDIIYRILVMCLNATVLYTGMGLYALINVGTVAGVLSIAWRAYLIHKTTSVRANFAAWDKDLFSEIIKLSFWVTVYSLASRLVFNITPTILGVVANSEAIAIFGVVHTIEGYVYLVSTAINGLFMKKIASIARGVNEEEDLTSLMTNVGQYQFLINAIFCVGFISIGKDFIQLWMGSDYLDAYLGVVLILLPGMIYNALEIAHSAMIFQNNAKKLAVTNIVTGFVNVTLSVFFSRLWGVIGASLSIFTAYIVRNILTLAVCRANLKADFRFFIKEVYLKPIPLILFWLLVGYLINNMIDVCSWFHLIIKGILIVAFMATSGGSCYLLLKKK